MCECLRREIVGRFEIWSDLSSQVGRICLGFVFSKSIPCYKLTPARKHIKIYKDKNPTPPQLFSPTSFLLIIINTLFVILGIINQISSMAVVAESQFHVLAVDDSLMDRKLIERLLKTSSFQVTTVDSGSKALEFLVSPDQHEIEVNLIITDYCMPGMTGYDLLKKIKESSYLKDIPVVIMSSENLPSRINRCLEEGAEEFFLKPVQLSDMSRLRPHLLKTKSKEEKEQHQEEEEEDSNSMSDTSSCSSSSSSSESSIKRKAMDDDEGILPGTGMSRPRVNTSLTED